jgi:hypothetical protein
MDSARIHTPIDATAGPTPAELRRIEREWPLIEAELDVTDTECRLAAAPGDTVALRAHRRAVRRLLAAHRALASTSATTAALPITPAA